MANSESPRKPERRAIPAGIFSSFAAWRDALGQARDLIIAAVPERKMAKNQRKREHDRKPHKMHGGVLI